MLLFLVCTSSRAQIINIPDENFKSYLIEEGHDQNGDGEIQISEGLKVVYIFIDASREISSLEGLNSFVNWTSINIFDDEDITTLIPLVLNS